MYLRCILRCIVTFAGVVHHTSTREQLLATVLHRQHLQPIHEHHCGSRGAAFLEEVAVVQVRALQDREESLAFTHNEWHIAPANRRHEGIEHNAYEKRHV